ncbi:MAG: hypothetical protein H6739_18380 [Alphaproteobacteria bacterium]|nr:hypothetical protein [Alphaproteobacteria bacterium]
MATHSVRSIASGCLGRSGSLSLRRDVFGVYGTNGQTRSLKTQLDRIRNLPFLRLGLVTVRPAGSTAGQYNNLQRDVDAANEVWLSDSNAWIYVSGVRTDTSGLLGNNGILDQTSCPLGVQSSPSTEEDDLFDLGRDLGADVVGYYIAGATNGLAGCSAYPSGRRGFWVAMGASQWVLAHELTHVIGLNPHVDSSVAANADNLMWPNTAWTNTPPDLNASQSTQLLGDDGFETC